MVSLYFHIPFCRHRCPYCDFNTYAGREALIPAYVDALCAEIRLVASASPGRMLAHTIFFGGGTPSLLSVRQFKVILKTVRDHFDLSALPEISLEANPGTLDHACLRDLRLLGFNRLSLGVQSAHAAELRLLGRIHDFAQVVSSVDSAREAGFEDLNLDLIFGLPGQSLDRWQATVKAAVHLSPQHLSLYALTIEPKTPFGRRSARGLLPALDPDLAADMYEWVSAYLESEGFVQYEISNWARDIDGRRTTGAGQSSTLPDESPPHYACKHNLQYWRNLPYLGFGAGAHGWAGGVRYSNVLHIQSYIDRLTLPAARLSHLEFPLSPAVRDHRRLTTKSEMQDTMITGLRLTREGVSASGFHLRFGRELHAVFAEEIDDLLRLGLLEWAGETSEVLRLTPRGRLLGNQAFMRFVG